MTGKLTFIDLKPSPENFLDAVVAGLSARPKTLPAKFFYDQRGSKLFEDITNLEEYYQTRTEMALLEDISGELKALIPKGSKLIEFGSGSSEKIRVLIDQVGKFNTYIPIDISRDYLKIEAESLASDHPDLNIIAICADYTKPFEMPEGMAGGADCTGFFPGSTIGNMTPGEAVNFLKTAGRLLGPGAGFIIGVDLKKDPAILYAAYNDAAGVTADFNLNILRRINNELGGDFDLGKFRHRAFYNVAAGRIEMHLESLAGQTASISGKQFSFLKGETIHTENSYKYNVGEFQALAVKAGLEPTRAWWDDDWLFSIHFLRVI
jgi:dimethylhistidine N-methyltransferase